MINGGRRAADGNGTSIDGGRAVTDDGRAMMEAAETRRPDLVIGLTGGIASGKSLVSNILADLGAIIIDVDVVARELQEPGQPALEAIAREFGEDILDGHGRLKRKALGDIVFNDRAALERLNRIMFPRLIDAVKGRLTGILENPGRGDLGRPVIVIDAAILFESGMDRLVDLVIAVHAPDESRVKRLMERNGCSREEAMARLTAQTPSLDILRRADFVIDNSGTADETRRQVAMLWAQLVGGTAGR